MSSVRVLNEQCCEVENGDNLVFDLGGRSKEGERGRGREGDQG